MRTALRSLVARDMRSPVRCAEIRGRQPLQVREEVVAQVVLDLARHADDERRIRNRNTPPTAARRTGGPRSTPSFPRVTPCCRSSTAYFSTHGPSSWIAVVARMQPTPKPACVVTSRSTEGAAGRARSRPGGPIPSSITCAILLKRPSRPGQAASGAIRSHRGSLPANLRGARP